MRHNIIFKFIAVFLCAASLLGIVGSGVGIFLMSELGLYSRSLEEAYAESTESTVQALVNEMAVRYASRELGGANEYLLDQYYGSYWMQTTFDWNQVGYTIYDAEGNVLEQQPMEGDYTSLTPFLLETSGSQYLNVLNSMTQEEYDALHNPVTEPAYQTTEPASQLTVYNAVPLDGSEIGYLQVSYQEGHSSEFNIGSEVLGKLTYYTSNQLSFQFLGESAESQHLMSEFRNYAPVGMQFLNTDGELVLEIGHPDGILEEFSDNHGNAYFLLLPLDEAVQLPMGSVYDAIPAEGQYVTRCSVTYADGWSESVGGTPDIGYLGYDEDGYVVFTASSSGILEYRTEQVTYISFHDESDNLVYEASDPEYVGTFLMEGDILVFRSWDATGGEPQLPAAEDNAYIYDDVPPQGYAVYKMDLWLKGSSTMLTIDNGNVALGIADHDSNGNVTFTAQDWRDFVFSKPAEVLYILMTDLDGRVLYEAYEAGAAIGTGSPIGTFAYNADGDLVFSRIRDELAVAAAAADMAKAVPAATEVPTADAAPEPPVAETEPQETAVPEETIPQAGEATEPETITDPTAADEAVPDAAEAAAIADEEDGTEPHMTEVPAIDETADITEPMPAEEPQVTVPVMTDETPLSTAPVLSTEPTMAQDAAEETVVPSIPPSTDPYEIALAEDTLRVFGYYDHTLGEHRIVEYTYEDMPEYQVEVVLGPGALVHQYEWVLLKLVYGLRDYLVFILVGSLLLFAITAVYLCCSAGRRPGSTEVRAGGLNCISLDLYLCGVVGSVMLCAIAFVEGGDYLLRQDINTGILFAALVAFAASLLIVAFCFAFAAQVKTPGGYWWRNSICGRSLKLIAWLWSKFVDLCGWLWDKYDHKIKPLLVRMFKALWKLVRFFFQLLKKGTAWLVSTLAKGTDWLGQKFTRFFSLLPLTWQWLLAGGAMILFLFITVAGRYDTGIVLSVLFSVALIIYGSHAFGTLLESAKRMSKGDLDEKVDDKLLVGAFRDFADELNGLADVAVVAAQKQLKSERMKTELITNVSHDIKTPLTSIINYVDLMEKPHSPEEQQAYLEVLSRQSQRLKKLIDDLMEMSKASTGNLAVDISEVNAVEAINQALGEFADKLDKAQLIPVFHQPDKDIYMMADGRLVWRVLSNLLSNAVKYALPGTRLYIDLMELEGKVVLSLKNISRDSLNINADELLERFVRGDTARNTEGSGLGLNIAQSLMELQKGKLEILVDGDLFKVTLIFPGA